MSKRAKAIKLHEDLDSCWRHRCNNPHFADKHKDRAKKLKRLSVGLTAHEQTLNRVGVMLETIKR